MAQRFFCLCMIVKNESKIIERCFDAIEPWVAEWVIHDTGSTDDTKQKIENYWQKKGVPGRLVSVDWKDFGHNRTKLVEDGRTSGRYLFLADADHLYTISEKFDPAQLTKAAYLVRQRDYCDYQNIRIVDSKWKWEYVGRTHELIQALDKNDAYAEELLENITLRELYDGGNRAQKFQRDVELLKLDLEEFPTSSRSMFYLAQTYWDLGNNEESERWYYKASEHASWSEEISYSLFRVGESRRKMMQPFDKWAGALLASYKADPERLEAISSLVTWARENQQFEFGYGVGAPHLFKPFPAHKRLFLDRNVWSWRLPDEIALCAFYSGRVAVGKEIWQKLMVSAELPVSERARIEKNLTFC